MKKRNFSAEFKRESAQLVVDQKYTVADAAKAMDVGLSTMTRWVKQLRDERQGKTPKASPITPEQIEIRKLRKKLQRIEMENEILKKATALLMSVNRPGILETKLPEKEVNRMTKNTRFSPEVRQRAIRMVLESQGEYDSQWAAICSIAPKIGCTPETLRVWVRQHERDTGGGDGGLTTAERQRLKELERENRELRRSNDILRQASAYFAKAEFDRLWKK